MKRLKLIVLTLSVIAFFSIFFTKTVFAEENIIEVSNGDEFQNVVTDLNENGGEKTIKLQDDVVLPKIALSK